MAAQKAQLKDPTTGEKIYPVTSSACVGMSNGSGSLDNKLTELEGKTELLPISTNSGYNSAIKELWLDKKNSIFDDVKNIELLTLRKNFVNGDYGLILTITYTSGNTKNVGNVKKEETYPNNIFPLRSDLYGLVYDIIGYIVLDWDKVEDSNGTSVAIGKAYLCRDIFSLEMNPYIAAHLKMEELSKKQNIELFVDSQQKIVEASPITDKIENKILKVDGTYYDIPSYDTYQLKNTENINSPVFVSCDFGVAQITQGVYLNVALFDENDKLLLAYIARGEKVMSIPYNYTLRVSVEKNTTPLKGQNITSRIEENKSKIEENKSKIAKVEQTVYDIEQRISFKTIIDSVGDSLSAAGKYESKLAELTGIEVINLGVGGEGVGTIFGRMNGVPYKVKEQLTIPSTTDSVQIKLTNAYNQLILPLLQETKTLEVVIRGIHGTLSTTQTDAAASSADYYFTRTDPGEESVISPGENVYIYTNAIYQDSERYKIIWVGQNGGYSQDETRRYQGSPSNQVDVDRYIQMIKTYINTVNPKKYLILSPPQNTADLLENELDKTFGCSYINVRKQMINNGISIALKYGYLAGDYPTEQDIQDISDGVVPTSLRSDSIHFNDAGYYVLAHIIYDVTQIAWNFKTKIVE